MNPVSPAAARRPGKYTILTTVTVVSFIVDQWTKYWAVARLTNALGSDPKSLTLWEKLEAFVTVEHPIPLTVVRVIDDFWAFKYVENPGAAWGFLAGAHEAIRIPFFITVSLVAIAIILAFFRKLDSRQHLLVWALSLVMGGALGNFVDRVVRNYVIDFVDWHWYNKPGWHWPTFNFADACISVGVGLLVVEMIWGAKDLPRAAAEPASSPAATPPPDAAPAADPPAPAHTEA